MKRYFTLLLALTLVMVLLAFAVKWFHMPFFEPLPVALLPLAVLYFAAVDGAQYWLTIRNVDKHPKAFVQSFLALSVGVLFLHLVVLVGGMLLHPASGKRFAVGFLILYVVYTVFIMGAFVRFMRRAGNGDRS